jgi:uncharacterized membrane protein YcaP (DUF421 family)
LRESVRNTLFNLNVNWWEPLLRATLIYAALLAFVRVSGRRTVGQFTPFDLLFFMLLSEAVSSALNGGEHSITGGVMAAATLVALNLSVAFITSRSKYLKHLVEGRAVLIGRNGEVFRDVLKKCRIPVLDVDEALREADCDLKDMKFAFLETDGGISILKESSGQVLSKDASL